MRWPRSLRTQIALSVAVLVAFVVAIAGFVIAVRIDDQSRDQIDRQLRARAQKVQSDGTKRNEGPGILSDAGKPPRADDELLAGTESLTRVLLEGEVVAQRGEGIPVSERVPAGPGLSTVTVDGKPWRSLVEPTEVVPGGSLQVMQSLVGVEEQMEDNRSLVALVTVIATLVTAATAWLVAGLVLRPLARLDRGAREIRSGEDTDRRLPEVASPEEIADLSRTLNEMLARLEVSMSATKRFTADAGHELRTPLTGLGMDIETLRRNPDLPDDQRAAMLVAMTREHRRIVELLGGLQQLARGDAKALSQRADVDVEEIVSLAVESAARRHPQIHFAIRRAGPAHVNGWPDGIRGAVDNLLDNAALHGSPGGAVEVEVEAREGSVRVIVDDDGPGIPVADRERLVERFARGSSPRAPGSGLGLAIVEQQAALHGGELILTDAPAGGLRAIVVFGRVAEHS